MACEKAPLAPRRTSRVVRWSILGIVLLGITILGVGHQYGGVGKPVGVDALCPFGGLETLGTLLAGGFLIKRVAVSSVLLLVAAVITAFVFRRAFCGRICPLGFLQEIFGGIGKRLFGRRFTVPAAIDRPARYLKYVLLAAILALSWSTATLVIRPYDPWAAYQHISSPELLTEFGIGFAVLLVGLVGSLAYDRFFCKYACPMGAFLGLISRVSVFKVRRSAETCVDCGVCDRACPVNVTVSTVDTVTDPECIDCGECVAACPVKDTLAVSAGPDRRLTPVVAAIASVGLFAALVAGATLTGDFAWTMPTLGGELERRAGDAGLPTGSATFDSSLIKGSTTVSEITDAAGIPPEVFTSVYGIPEAEQAQALKDLKDIYGAYPGDVRAFVDAYLADPSVADTYVPGQFHSEEDEDH